MTSLSRTARVRLAVVTGDRDAGHLGQVVSKAAAPGGEVGEHQDAFAGSEDRLDDLFESGEFAGSADQRLAVVTVRRRVVADLLQGGDRCQDRTLLGLAERRRIRDTLDEFVEHRLVETDLLGRHRAVVELVDLVG